MKVYGILAEGDASCRGTDYFVNVASAHWTTERTANLSCGDLGNTGECFGSEVAVHCNAGILAVESCASNTTCGWDTSKGRYGCLNATRLGCEEFDSWGTCQANHAIRCEQGSLTSIFCDCGRCQRSPITGRVGCVP